MNGWEITQKELDSHWNSSPAPAKLTKKTARKKEAKSILLADRLEAIGFTLFRDNFGYKVVKERFEVIVRNLDKLETLVAVLELCSGIGK
jgi:hypothetical protein